MTALAATSAPAGLLDTFAERRATLYSAELAKLPGCAPNGEFPSLMPRPQEQGFSLVEPRRASIDVPGDAELRLRGAEPQELERYLGVRVLSRVETTLPTADDLRSRADKTAAANSIPGP